MGQVEKDQLGGPDGEEGESRQFICGISSSSADDRDLRVVDLLQRVWEAADRSTRKGEIDGKFLLLLLPSYPLPIVFEEALTDKACIIDLGRDHSGSYRSAHRTPEETVIHGDHRTV